MNKSITLSEKDIARFWSKVKIGNPDECWEWQAHRNEKGYGTISYFKHHFRAHRISWMINFGEIKEDLEVLHKCDNRCCVNPIHLFLGTQYDNMHDMINKGRNVFGEKHKKAKLSESSVFEIIQLLKTKSANEISEKFGVSRRLISAIGQGKKWKHVERK